MGRLQGKVALVTGAGSGIGRASARLFAGEGAKVVAVDRAESVHETADMIKAAGGAGLALTGDAGFETDVAAAVAKAVEAFGGLDVCYANAGVSAGVTPLFELTADDWTNILRINLIGPFLAIKHAAQAMVLKGSGSIICTASVAGLRSGAGGISYSASKAGVINLVQTTAQQLTGTGVRVNAICPGLIETGMTKPLFDRARERGAEKKIGQLNPLRRGGIPDEIARAALFLASEDASYVNGQALVVDGGLSSSHPVASVSRIDPRGSRLK
ncbi:SDR family oxidoreductase [Bradyrhizobium brasilense]|uniref:SDR family NAD(P)-dependent oxidoreductase n=1 Tax=Bradyrhizobium brasilense TaxID=1419277 RepID=UPI002877FC44|nr:SDR family NAD(P)-dependent oxidoreductase [Bradyrhizobium brasilense]MCP3419602.1 SDR family oxidoreductase [Bradyrhizobium brasilense]